MNVTETAIPGLLVIEPAVFGDERGFFTELFHAGKYAEAGVPGPFVQDNLSRSRRGTLRGLHYQIGRPQGKLVRALSGVVLDVIVDLRRSSPAFGQSATIELDADKHTQAYVPEGCAHGFVVLSESADFFYKCTDLYAPEQERTLLWNDPALGIDWRLGDVGVEPLLSEKDRAGRPLAECETYA